MVLNPFFTQGTSSEQNLVQDLINEQLRTYGVDIFYLPRKYLTTNTVIKEVVQSTFDIALPLEAYIDNYDSYSGAGNILSKFGIQSQDEVRLVISRERFENYISPLIEDQSNIKLSTRPKSGDLIWFPLDDRVYEIKDIEYAKPYYQLQDLYTYELYCELFQYENEVIATGIDEIDNNLVGDDSDGITDDGINTVQGITQRLTLVGSGSTAGAYAGIITSGGIRLFAVNNRGGGYLTTPTIGLSSAPSGGVTGIATADMIGGIVVCNENVNSNAKSVQAVNIINPGAGYTIAPLVRFNSNTGVGAAASAFIGNGTIGIVTITSTGNGFTTAPTITFPSPVGLGTTATGVSVITSGGLLSDIYMTNAGAGYTSGDLPINITISSPNMSSTGDFAFNEIVKGSESNTTARVRVWDSVTNILEVATIDGDFNIGEHIIGQTSGADHVLRVRNSDPKDDGFAQNISIETEADSIIDFTESNPFGMP